jgi:PAS domain S-box-containing protein
VYPPIAGAGQLQRGKSRKQGARRKPEAPGKTRFAARVLGDSAPCGTADALAKGRGIRVVNNGGENLRPHWQGPGGLTVAQHSDTHHVELLRRLLDSAVEPAVILLDADSVIIGWFMGAEKTFGYTAEEIMGQNSSVLYTPEDRELGIPEYEVAVALKRGFSENDRWMQRKDGLPFWASGILNPIVSPAGELLGFAKSLRNRTDSKGKIDALENQIESQRQAGAARSLSISTLAHELRGPLSAVSYAVEVMRQSASPDEMERSALEIIDRQCQSMSRLIDDLLDVTRLQVGKFELKKSPVCLADTAGRAIDTCRGSIQKRRQRLEFIRPSGNIWVVGDAQRLSQVIINLVQNATKFTPDEGSIWVKISNEGNDAVIRVEDNGSGISPEALPRIFEMFAQATPVSSAQDTGVGIGLALVKEIVELHGGTVQVRSDGPGKGSEFVVRLPLAEASAA